MQRYAAFFRDLNVGGRNKVNMNELQTSLCEAGFGGVETRGSSGNIIFSSNLPEDALASTMDDVLRSVAGKEILMFVRTQERMEEIISGDQFPDHDDGKRFITFLQCSPSVELDVPVSSPSGDAMIVCINGLEAFGLAYLNKGRHGDVNRLVESKTGVRATTRTYEAVADVVRTMRKVR